MNLLRHISTTAALVVLSLPSLQAGVTVDPSGHWEGTVQASGAEVMEVSIEVDLAKNAKGELIGALNTPSLNLKGLPLSNFALDGNSISFQVKGKPGEHAFKGALSADGKSISGDYMQGGHTLPFTLTRTGDAKFEAPAKIAAIGKEFEGTWTGTLEYEGKKSTLVMTMANQPDGTATGTLVKIGEGLEIPVTSIAQKASSLTVALTSVGVTYTANLNADGTEMTGMFTQGPVVLPLNFRRK